MWCYVTVLPQLPTSEGLSSSMTQHIVFPYLGKSALRRILSIDRHNYCCDPFKKHRCRVYLHLRVALIAEHPSLSLRSGDLLCANCLKAVIVK